jgi:hypothetical protein
MCHVQAQRVPTAGGVHVHRGHNMEDTHGGQGDSHFPVQPEREAVVVCYNDLG